MLSLKEYLPWLDAAGLIAKGWDKLTKYLLDAKALWQQRVLVGYDVGC